MLVTQFATDLLNHILQNANIGNIGDATGLRGSTAAGNLYLSIHTADPGRAGSQTTNEIAYTGYARVAISRTGTWTIASGQAQNNAAITFPQATGGSGTAAFWGLGTAASGAGVLLMSGAIGPSNQGPFSATAADVITVPGHTLAVNDTIVFYGLFGVALPTGITEGTVYFVKTVSGNDITISTTQGGTTLDITAAGDGVIYKVSSLAISQNITPEFAINAVTLKFE